jgi:phage baseplate assembly protein V
MAFVNELHRFLSPVYRRIAVLISRGILQTIDDSKNIPLIKVSLGASEVKDALEYLQTYGFTSVPEQGAETVIAFIGGNRDNGVAIAVGDSRSRKKDLASGDVCVYRKGGDFILFTEEGIEINSSGKVVVNCTDVVLGGSTGGPTSGVVTGECICAYTGSPHPDTSTKVKAVK